MNIWTDKNYPIILSVAKKMVPWTEQEVKKLGYKVDETTGNMVVLHGSMRDVFRLNLNLRTAQRVLVPLLRCECRHIRELYNKATTIEWENLLEPDSYFSVSSIVNNATIRDTRLPSLTLKDAVVDRIRSKCGIRPDSGSDYDRGAALYLHWEKNTAIIYIDTTGTPLSKRGYRKIPGSAPMQETLAAACIDAMQWDCKTPFIFPMCGSGTPAIEAALKAIRRAPGSLRPHFSFFEFKGFKQIIPGEKAPRTAPRQRFGVTPEQIWKDMVLESAENEQHENLPPIIATDISPEAIQNARINANAAGVSEFISFQACDFASTPIPDTGRTFIAGKNKEKFKGCVFFNPEYGIRLGTTEELVPVYRRMADFMHEKCNGFVGGIITGNPDLAKEVELFHVLRVPFFNGPIDCRLIIYPGCKTKDCMIKSK